MLTSILNNTTSSIEITSILICSLCSIILGFIIAYTHMKTSNYNKNFLVTLTILPIIVQTVIILVNGNLGTSVAILGAFSLVRFRSIPGTSKEILSVFFAMTIGIATGMGHVFFAMLITIITTIALIIFSKIKLFDKNQYEKILKITIPENLDYTTVFDDIFEKYLNKATLEKTKTTNMGSMFDLSYRVLLKENTNEKELIDEIRTRNGNLKIILTHPLEQSDL